MAGYCPDTRVPVRCATDTLDRHAPARLCGEETFAATPCELRISVMAVRFSGIRPISVLVTTLASLFLLTAQDCPIAPGQPVAVTVDAGPDGTIDLDETFTFAASASGGTGTFTFLWTPATGLDDANVAQPTFTPTTAGQFSFTLTVADSGGATGTDTVTVTVNPNGGGGGGSPGDPLEANAGADRTSSVGAPMVLNGSATGGDGDYTFLWTTTGGTLTNEDTLTPTFTSSVAGTFTLTFTVTDGTGATDSDTASIEVTTTTTLSSLTWGANFGGEGYEVVAVFTNPLDEITAEQAENYKINDTGDPATSATLNAAGTSVSIVFPGPLTSDTEFDISVGTAIKDANGAAVPQTIGLEPLTNSADTTAPTITTRTWGVDFAGSYRVHVVFSESIDAFTADNTAAFRINQDGEEAAPLSVELQEDGRTMDLLFDNITLSSAGATLDAGLATIRDMNGNKLALSAAAALTANALDVSGPNVVADSIQYLPNYTDGGYAISLEFNEAMDKASAQTLTAYKITGGANPATALLEDDGRTVMLTFATPLDTADTLDVSVSNALKDINGQALTALTAQTINASAADVTKPTSPTLTWLAGSASTGYQLTALFNEAMDETTVETLANWRITGTTTNPTAAALGNDGKTVTLTFGVVMSRTTKISVSFGSTIKDINGNIISQISLPIGANTADTTSPTIATAPMWSANGTTYVMTLTFSEVMDNSSAGNAESYTMVRGTTPVTELDQPTSATLDAAGRIVTLTFATTTAGFRRGAATPPDQLRLSSAVRDINGRSTTATTPQAITANAEANAPTTTSISFGINSSPTTVNVAYNEVMDAATAANVGNYALGAGDTPPTAATLSPDGKTAILTFGTGTFSAASQLDITNAVLDINGNAFAGVNNTAVAQDGATDTTRPTLASQVWSVNNAQYRVVATFSEPVSSATANTAGNYLLSGVAANSATLQGGGTSVVLTFNNAFALDAVLTVTNVQDLNGNAVSGAFGIVMPDPDDTLVLPAAPATVMWGANQATYTVIATIANEVLDKTTAELAANYQLSTTFDSPATSVLSTADGKTVTLNFITPSAALPLTTTLDFSLGGSILDVNGQSLDQVLAQPIAANGADVTAPSATNPPVETGTNTVLVDFNEVMDATSANVAGNYAWSGGLTTLNAALQPDGQLVLLTLTGDPSGETVTITNVKDINGNNNAACCGAALP